MVEIVAICYSVTDEGVNSGSHRMVCAMHPYRESALCGYGLRYWEPGAAGEVSCPECREVMRKGIEG